MKHLFNLLVFNLFIIISTLGLHAQGVYQVDTRGTWGGASLNTPGDSIWIIKNNELKGNPFLFEDWNTKGLLYSKGITLEVDHLNYNIYKEEIGELKDNESYFVYDSQFIDSVKIDSKCLHKLEGNFYEPLYTGSKASLYKKYNTRIAQGQFNPTDGTIQQSRIVIVDDYYVLAEEKLVKFKPSKSRLIDIFGDHTQEINIIKKEENLDLKNEENLISLFQYYNNI